MNRLEKYCRLLEDIYGKSIVKSFTTRKENNSTLKMNDVANNQKAKKDYKRAKGEGCTACKSIFRNPNFSERNLEFPGWIEYLDFSETHAKEIMIIGEEPTTLKDQINIAFGLGYYPIKSDGKLDFEQLRKTYSGEKKLLDKIINNQTNNNKLWEYLNRLFSGKLNDIKPKIYITDLCKCNDDIKSKIKKEQKNTKIWEKCCKNYLIKEIELINPKLIIFQGWNSYKYLKKYLKDKDIIVPKKAISDSDNIKKYYPKHKEYSKTSLCYNPFYGKFSLNGNQIHFFIIFHQVNFTSDSNRNKCNRNDYTDRHKEFVKKEILTKVLNIK